MTKINYPTWRVRGSPTPAEALFICDKCGDAIWGQANPLHSFCYNNSCKGRKGGAPRLRKATAAETEEAKRHLECEIV